MNTAALDKLSDKVFQLKYQDKETFWNEEITPKGKIYTVLEPKFRKWLQKEGFRALDVGYKDPVTEPIRIVNNIASKVRPEDIFKHALKFIQSYEDARLEAAFIKQGETLLLQKKATIIALEPCETPRLRDTKKTSYHFYKNGIVKVKAASEFELIPYAKANGFVWETEIKEREFSLLTNEDLEKAMFAMFVQNITNSEEHFLSLCSALGYLMHRYKNEGLPICIIINDENLIDEGKPEGGTGKGILVKAVSQIVEKAMYNGKNSDFSNNKFAYQNVKETTAIINIDDAPRNFDFEALFSVLSDDMPVERKHQAVKVIPYRDSPKFVITTNYTIKGNSSSFKRRRFDTFLTDYYSSIKTPVDDFGCEFFNGWSREEWQLFDCFMMNCLRIYLSQGLIQYENEGLRLKMLKNETAPEFYEMMEEEFAEKHIRFYYKEVITRLCEVGGESFYFLNKRSKTMVQWVKSYSDFKGVAMKHDRANGGFFFEFLDSPGGNP